MGLARGGGGGGGGACLLAGLLLLACWCLLAVAAVRPGGWLVVGLVCVRAPPE